MSTYLLASSQLRSSDVKSRASHLHPKTLVFADSNACSCQMHVGKHSSQHQDVLSCCLSWKATLVIQTQEVPNFKAALGHMHPLTKRGKQPSVQPRQRVRHGEVGSPKSLAFPRSAAQVVQSRKEEKGLDSKAIWKRFLFDHRARTRWVTIRSQPAQASQLYCCLSLRRVPELMSHPNLRPRTVGFTACRLQDSGVAPKPAYKRQIDECIFSGPAVKLNHDNDCIHNMLELGP